MKKVLSLILAAVMLTVMLVGCGGAKNGIDAIKSSGKLTVYTEAGFAPYEFYYNNEIVGVDMEIMALFAQSIGKELYISNMEFNAVCLAVSSSGGTYEDENGNVITVAGGMCDVAAAGLTVNEKRAEILDFTKDYPGMFTLTDSPAEAAKDADVIFTDVWASMGQEGEAEKRRAAFKGYQVNAELLANAKPDCMVQHCLPAHRGEEISADVFEAHSKEIFDEAENRLHAQKAVMVTLMRN